MRIVLKTKVQGHYQKVMEGFDRNLFEKLLPKGAKVELKEFTGSKKGDRVHLQFISPFKADWISDIIDDGCDESKCWFVDKGVVVPFGLKNWEHHHIVEKLDDNSSVIIDDIRFNGKWALWTLALYPGLLAGFSPRKRLYQQYFGAV